MAAPTGCWAVDPGTFGGRVGYNDNQIPYPRRDLFLGDQFEKCVLDDADASIENALVRSDE
jgi:hypothetical protein